MDKLKLSAGKHCRGCLQPCDYQMYSLASKDVPVGVNNQLQAESVVNLAEIYNLCTQMLYEYTSPNWEFICELCFRKLTEFFEFRQMCIESYNKIKEIELIDSRQAESDEMCFKVEMIDVTQILEPEQIASHDDSFGQEATTSNWDEKADSDPEETVRKDDKIDEETKHRARSSRSQTHRIGSNEPSNDERSEFLEVESRDYHEDDDDDDDDTDYDAQDDEDENSDDEQSAAIVKVETETPNKSSKKSKKTKSTKKPGSGEFNYACDVCPKKFFKKHRYDAHKRTHLGLKQWKCDHCERAYGKYTSLKLHIAAKHSEGEQPIFACEIDGCDKSYSMKESLRVHISKVHQGKKPTFTARMCEQCGKSFNSNAGLIRHSYTHTKLTPFKCEICSKMFATKYKLKEHTMRHDGIKNFVCPTCGLRKTTGHELRVHMKYHNDDVQFPCNLCSLIFTREANMKRHIKVVHLGVKAFNCPHCDRSFGKAETLKHHAMTHTGERPLACSVCGKRFIQPIALKTHMKTHNKPK